MMENIQRNSFFIVGTAPSGNKFKISPSFIQRTHYSNVTGNRLTIFKRSIGDKTNYTSSLPVMVAFGSLLKTKTNVGISQNVLLEILLMRKQVLKR